MKRRDIALPDISRLRWQTWLILGLATVFSVCAYLAYSAFTYRTGFPLDDAWIHQTYARNLALRGEWSFIPGQVSGGSTSPLWSALLAVGFLLGLSPYLWTFCLGGLVLFALAVCAEISMRRLIVEYRSLIPWAGLLIVFEWHLVWAAVSGMETLLQALFVFVVLTLLINKSDRWALLGMLAGVSVWIRPDGITLLGPIVFVALMAQSTWRSRVRSLVSVFVGFGVFFVPYLLFNLVLADTALPTTFYAKQAEYISWQAKPIWERTGDVFLKMLTGVGIALLPGIFISVRRAVRSKDLGIISALLWVIGYHAIYVLRLPAYQHGRYLMPAMPIFFFIGLAGYFSYFYDAKKVQTPSRWFLKTSWSLILLLIGLSFWFLGMNSYSNDVRFIESEMVDTAKWVATNIPDEALVAAHDIGALGYFGEHALVDLAGLISPETIPFLRDETALANYLDMRDVAYLVAFPDWYPLLTSDLEPVFSTGALFAQSLGETNMAVYQWPGP